MTGSRVKFVRVACRPPSASLRGLAVVVGLLALLIGAPVCSPVAGAFQTTPASGAESKKTSGKDSKADTSKEILPAAANDSEVKLGRENAEENDKQVKLITDAVVVERVNRIGQEIAAAANKYPITAHYGSTQLKQFNYTFKIVDDKDPNAYSLPGGFIYVHKGLLDMVHSDDELAGVLAHEVSHAAHHHMVKLIREQNKMDRLLLPLKLLAVIAMATSRGSAPDVQNVLLGTQLYSIAKMNTYGVEAEKDADATGIRLLTHTHYNPVGLYSFMIRLAALEKSKTYADMGIFRTHPPGEERVEACKKLLEELNIPIRISEVDPTERASVTLAKTGGVELAEVRLRDVVLCRVVGADGLSAVKRGHQVAEKLDGLMDSGLLPFQIRANREQTRVLARGVPLLTDADATAQNKSVTVLARELSDAVTLIKQKRMLEGGI